LCLREKFVAGAVALERYCCFRASRLRKTSEIPRLPPPALFCSHFKVPSTLLGRTALSSSPLLQTPRLSNSKKIRCLPPASHLLPTKIQRLTPKQRPLAAQSASLPTMLFRNTQARATFTKPWTSRLPRNIVPQPPLLALPKPVRRLPRA